MAITVVPTAYGTAAAQALRDAVARAKRVDALAPVTVVVPTNSVGVSARRRLASGEFGPTNESGRGVVGVTFLTVYRLAELLGAAGLAAAGRRPVSTPVVASAVRRGARAGAGSVRAGRPASGHGGSAGRRASRSRRPRSRAARRPRRAESPGPGGRAAAPLDRVTPARRLVRRARSPAGRHRRRRRREPDRARVGNDRRLPSATVVDPGRGVGARARGAAPTSRSSSVSPVPNRPTRRWSRACAGSASRSRAARRAARVRRGRRGVERLRSRRRDPRGRARCHRRDAGGHSARTHGRVVRLRRSVRAAAARALRSGRDRAQRRHDTIDVGIGPGARPAPDPCSRRHRLRPRRRVRSVRGGAGARRPRPAGPGRAVGTPVA